MTEATDLWDSVVANYPAEGILSLTNVRAPEATAIDATYGATAAQEAIDSFPLYAQIVFAPADAQHVLVGRRAVIAILFERGGTSSEIAKVEYDEVYGDGGLMEKLQRTGARGRSIGQSNSGVRQRSELTSNGKRVLGWSDADALPGGRRYLPRRIIAEDL
jgi:hypothetical protein